MDSLFSASLTAREELANALATVLLLIVLAVAVFFDVRERRIPNWLIASGMLFLFPICFVGGSETVFSRVLGFCLCFTVMLPAYCFFGLGAGDVKLSAVIGGCCGPTAGFNVLIWTQLSAGLVAMFTLMICRSLSVSPKLPFVPSDAASADGQRKETAVAGDYSLPMAVFFAVGTMCQLSCWRLI